MRPLFRPEAVAAQRAPWLGRVRLARPLPLSLVTALIAALALAVAAFVTLAPYTRKATVAGVLVPDLGLIRVVPGESGTVLERRVTEGQVVRAGELLFVLALERARLPAAGDGEVRRSLAERQRSLKATARRQRDQAATQRVALERRLQALAAEQAQVEAEATLLRSRLALAEQSQARLEALRRDQFVSDAQVQLRQEELLALQAQLQALARQGTALAREKAQLDGDLRLLPMLYDDARDGYERDLAEVVRETAEQDAARRLPVHAPGDGRIGALTAEVGQAVSPASALATLLPQGAVLQAHLFAPSSAIGFVRPGLPVRLRLDAYPYQRFGHVDGRVLAVSPVPLAAGELAALAAGGPRGDEAAQPQFRITVALADGASARLPGPLAAGMRMQADLLLERRRLVEWMFEPLLGLRERLREGDGR